jgi:HAD superfamily hydrolase (TIGR01509 family)
VIHAIIFDCFGVLCSEGWIPFKRKHFGHDRELEQQATDLSKQLNAGLLSNDGFVQRIAELAAVPKSEALTAVQHNVPDEELFSYIQTNLKWKYKLGILSNAGGNRLQELFTPEQMALFDEAALSFETGYVKPDARAYEQVAATLGVRTEECVFVDDQERHCDGARAANMHAIRYDNFEQFKSELASTLGDTEN